MTKHVVDIQVAGMMRVNCARRELPDHWLDRLDDVQQTDLIESIVRELEEARLAGAER
jgi:hypothetical protein